MKLPRTGWLIVLVAVADLTAIAGTVLGVQWVIGALNGW